MFVNDCAASGAATLLLLAAIAAVRVFGVLRGGDAVRARFRNMRTGAGHGGQTYWRGKEGHCEEYGMMCAGLDTVPRGIVGNTKLLLYTKGSSGTVHDDDGAYTENPNGMRIVATLWASPAAQASVKFFRREAPESDSNPAFHTVNVRSGSWYAMTSTLGGGKTITTADGKVDLGKVYHKAAQAGDGCRLCLIIDVNVRLNSRQIEAVIQQALAPFM